MVLLSIPIIGMLLTTAPKSSRRAVATGQGVAAWLERYEFQTNRVRYELTHPWRKALEKILPDWTKQKIGLLQPTFTDIVVPLFPGEALLSVAVSMRPPMMGLRLIVADEQGQEFDPAAHSNTGSDGYWVAEVPAFPRRGKELRLRVASNTNILAEFRIPNPAPGPHPQWKAKPLPVSVQDGDLEASLVSFQAKSAGDQTFKAPGAYPRTECVFKFREQGQETSVWTPVSFEVSDATGNHWNAWPNPEFAGITGTEVRSGFLGALWPGEGAWKLKVEFKRTANFPQSELLHIEHLPAPGPEQLLEPRAQYQVNGAMIEVAAIIGKDVVWDRVYQLNPNRKRGCVTILLTGRILSQDRRLNFQEAQDEHGRTLKLASPLNEPGKLAGQGADLLPYSLNFEVGNDTEELNVRVAVSQSRFLEFLAKPEQVSLR